MLPYDLSFSSSIRNQIIASRRTNINESRKVSSCVKGNNTLAP